MTRFSQDVFGDEQDTVQRSVADLGARTSAQDSAWGLGRADWAADLNAGTITFTNETFRAVAPVQVVGTYDTAEATWLWGWDHPSVPAALGRAAQQVRDWARERGLPALLERRVQCSQEDAWAFTALAATLSEAQGAYRGPAGPTLVFMTFGAVHLTAPHKGEA